MPLHWRGFLTKYNWKRTASNQKDTFSTLLNKIFHFLLSQLTAKQVAKAIQRKIASIGTKINHDFFYPYL